MSLAMDRERASPLLEGAATDGRGARLVARTLFRELQRSGYTNHQVLAFADELLGCLCATVRSREEAVAPPESQDPN